MLGLFLVIGKSMAGSLTPSNAPAPTMHSLEQIYQEIIKVHDRITPTTVIYSSTIVSTLAKTGQTNSFHFGDDGTYQQGASWATPRFIIGSGSSSNCVTDQMTGLMWLRNPSATPMNWTNAINYCEDLDGSDGRGGFNDWRLPNFHELLSLIDARFVNPVLPNTAGDGHSAENDPFTGIQSDSYWSSTTFAGYTDNARIVNLGSGITSYDYKTIARYALAVRGQSVNYYNGGNSSSSVVNEYAGSAALGNTTFSGTASHVPIHGASVTLIMAGDLGSFTDDGAGHLSGQYHTRSGDSFLYNATGTINYNSGQWTLTLSSGAPLAENSSFTISYSYGFLTTNLNISVWGSPIVGEADGTTGVHRVFYNGGCNKVPIIAGSLTVVFGALGNFRDDACGKIIGQYIQTNSSASICNATGTVDYNTGIWTINLASGSPIEEDVPITLNYQWGISGSTNSP
jgi:hypothetical protein